MRLLIFILIFAFSACSPKPGELRQKAQEAIRDGDLGQAKEYLTELVEENSGHAEALFKLGQVEEVLNNHESAQSYYQKSIEAFDKRIKKNPNKSATDRLNRAIALAAMGKVDQAFAIIDGLRDHHRVSKTIKILQIEKPSDLLRVLAQSRPHP